MVKVVVEFTDEQPNRAGMRWEKCMQASAGAGSDLLGQAFDVIQREERIGIAAAMEAFLAGAMLQKEDVAMLVESEREKK